MRDARGEIVVVGDEQHAITARGQLRDRGGELHAGGEILPERGLVEHGPGQGAGERP